jgi:hypothetical protein
VSLEIPTPDGMVLWKRYTSNSLHDVNALTKTLQTEFANEFGNKKYAIIFRNAPGSQMRMLKDGEWVDVKYDPNLESTGAWVGFSQRL